MNADHIGDAQGWRDIATAPRSDPFYRADAKAKLDDVLKQCEW